MIVEDACEEEDFAIDDWYEEDIIHPLPPPDIDIDTPLVTEAEKTSLSFMDDYAKSNFAPVIKIVDMLFARSMWSGIHVATSHPPTSGSEIVDVLYVFRAISHGVGEELAIDSSIHHQEISGD
jgi:hypothetical protein